MKGLVFSIKRYSVHDGPGIRVTFFMKGCPLSCWWCHNPEGISPLPENVELTEKVGEREFRKNVTAGEWYSVNDILGIIEKEKIFISESKGGVTFSGGEPLLQIDFLLEALKACKSHGYHTAVDTSGYSQLENFTSILPFTDLFLFDIKHMDAAKHSLYTGVSNKLILSNLKMLLNSGKDIMIRVPVIPGVNDDPENMDVIRKLLEEHNSESIKKINLLPFHRIAASKYRKLNIPDKMSDIKPPASERMKNLKAFFEETGIKVKIGG
jgi:pyruvate formate lyase activating enzyme